MRNDEQVVNSDVLRVVLWVQPQLQVVATLVAARQPIVRSVHEINPARTRCKNQRINTNIDLPTSSQNHLPDTDGAQRGDYAAARRRPGH